MFCKRSPIKDYKGTNPSHQNSRRRSGQVLVIVSLSMIALLGMVGLAIDGGNLYAQRRQVQNAADAGALAGARVMASGVRTNGLVWEGIYNYTKKNLVADPNTDVIATYTDNQRKFLSVIGPSVSGEAPVNADGVHVVANRTVPTFFLRAIGIRSFPARAVAAAQVTNGKRRDYAVFAGRSVPGTRKNAQGKKVIQIEKGKNVLIDGDIHSNSGVSIKGKNRSLTVKGILSHVTGVYPRDKAGNFKGRVNFDPPQEKNLIKTSVQPYPVSYNINDFRPGGSEAERANSKGDYHFFSGKTDLSSQIVNGVLPTGIYFVDGDVTLKSKIFKSARVTIVATGKVNVDTSQGDWRAYTQNLLFYSGKNDSSSKGNKAAMKLRFKDNSIDGIAFAPSTGIRFKANRSTMKGSLIGLTVKLTGKDFTLRAQGAPSGVADVVLYE